MTASPDKQHSATLPLAVAAVGVVYGDIGTSPLYTMKEVFTGSHAIAATPDHVLGILSLIFWSLIVVVSVKYGAFIMQADNRGEGGIMALTAVTLRRAAATSGAKARFITILGIVGAALFYGDGAITPAISVLSAVEGLEVATPALAPYVIPISLTVLVGLFLFQRKGTASVGALFGPVMCVWFATLAALGVWNIAQTPEVLKAFNPLYAVWFFVEQRLTGFLALGAVVLAITGAEALYADMGHFGRRPIRLAWFLFVLPAIFLNYLGQGALILREPEAVRNPFYHLAPDALLYPMVALSTLATIIASQAVISGAFSLTKQAMQLGYTPRVAYVHTSEREIGQIYVPGINWMLALAVAALVLGFKSSSALASAYGIAVTGTMMIDTVLAFILLFAVRHTLLKRTAYFLLLAGFLIVDIAFFGANTVKILEGGWFPLALGAAIFLLLSTWREGRRLLTSQMLKDAIPLGPFLAALKLGPPHRSEGTAVFMTTNLDAVPRALMHNLYHNKVLHERVVLLKVGIEDVPHVPDAERVTIEPLELGFYRVLVRYGFKDEPDIPVALELCGASGLAFELQATSFFLGRETIVPVKTPLMPPWREKLFIWMFRNSGSATEFFRLPPNRVIELGTQVEM